MDFETTIHQIMTTDLTTVGPQAKVENFKHIFNRRGFHHLPVEDKDRKLIGIISTEDVNRTSRFLAPSDSLLAEHIMSPSPLTIQGDTKILDAVNFFLENQVRALPVLDAQGNFVGLITPYDLMKEIVRACEMEEELNNTEDYV